MAAHTMALGLGVRVRAYSSIEIAKTKRCRSCATLTAIANAQAVDPRRLRPQQCPLPVRDRGHVRSQTLPALRVRLPST